MSEQAVPPKSIYQAATEFMKDLLRHFHHDSFDVSEDPEEAEEER